VSNGHSPYENTTEWTASTRTISRTALRHVIGANLAWTRSQGSMWSPRLHCGVWPHVGRCYHAITRSGTNHSMGASMSSDRDKIFDARNFFDPVIFPRSIAFQFGHREGSHSEGPNFHLRPTMRYPANPRASPSIVLCPPVPPEQVSCTRRTARHSTLRWTPQLFLTLRCTRFRMRH